MSIPAKVPAFMLRRRLHTLGGLDDDDVGTDPLAVAPNAAIAVVIATKRENQTDLSVEGNGYVGEPSLGSAPPSPASQRVTVFQIAIIVRLTKAFCIKAVSAPIDSARLVARHARA